MVESRTEPDEREAVGDASYMGLPCAGRCIFARWLTSRVTRASSNLRKRRPFNDDVKGDGRNGGDANER